MRDALLVAVGAVPGAWLRFRLINHLEPLLPRRHWGTCCVNLIACFALGPLSALQVHGNPEAERLMLLLGTGFLGSFSTFSTLLAESAQSVGRGERLGALSLLLASLAGGLVAFRIGQALVS